MTRKRADNLRWLLQFEHQILARGERACFRWHGRRGYVANSPQVYGLQVTDRGKTALSQADKTWARHARQLGRPLPGE